MDKTVNCKYHFRRNFKQEKFERWTSYCTYEEGFVAMDVIAISWNINGLNVDLISNSYSRMNDENYKEAIFNLFEDITDGEDSFVFRSHYVLEPCDYYPEELLHFLEIGEQ